MLDGVGWCGIVVGWCWIVLDDVGSCWMMLGGRNDFWLRWAVLDCGGCCEMHVVQWCWMELNGDEKGNSDEPFQGAQAVVNGITDGKRGDSDEVVGAMNDVEGVR